MLSGHQIGLAQPSCIGSSTVADTHGADIGSNKLTVGLFGLLEKYEKENGYIWTSPSISEAIFQVRCEGDQSFEVWRLVSHCQFVLKLLPQSLNLHTP